MQSPASAFGYFDRIDYFICGHFTKNLGQNPRKNQAVELALTTYKILSFWQTWQFTAVQSFRNIMNDIKVGIIIRSQINPVLNNKHTKKKSISMFL